MASATPPLQHLLSELDAKVQADYEQSAAVASNDPQQAGHLAEATCGGILERWVPEGYSIGLRKYIVPEIGTDGFETDLVIFRPDVPRVIREQAQVPHGAVAAAFSVKRTLRRDGIRDAVDRAVRLRRSMDRSNLRNRAEAVYPAYPVGLLAMSHDWKDAPENVAATVTRALLKLDEEHATEPAHSLDLCCVGQLGTWHRTRVAILPVAGIRYMTGDDSAAEPRPVSLLLDPLAGSVGPLPANPVGQFIRDLYSSLEMNNPQLKEFAYSLRRQVSSPSGASPARLWTDYDLSAPVT